MNVINMPKEEAEELFYKFNDIHSERNVLLLGEKIRPEDIKTLFRLQWNTVITLMKKQEQIDELCLCLNNSTRRTLVLNHDIIERKLSTHSTGSSLSDVFDLNIIQLFDNSEEDSFHQNRKAKKILQKVLTNLLGTYGTLYCVGYSIEDSFLPNDLIECFIELEEKRNHDCIYMFGIECSFIDLTKYECNNVVLVAESLSELWDEYLKTYTSSEKDIYTENNDDLMIYIGGKTCFVPKSEIKDIMSFAQLLDFKTMTPTPKEKYRYRLWFASFLKHDMDTPKWYGYREKFYLKRDYHQQLIDVVNISLDQTKVLGHRAILLHGQSGSGKTIAMGLLAYKVFHEKKYPVIYISNPNVSFFNDGDDKKTNVYFERLKSCLQYLQNTKGANAILLIWDCSGHDRERFNYIKLYKCLKNYGINVVLVGTSYQLFSKSSTNKELYDIEASIAITEKDLLALELLLKKKARLDDEDSKFIIDHLRADLRNNRPNSENFLAILYNVFWNIRGDVANGIQKEFQRTLDDLKTAVNDDIGQYSFFTSITLKRYDQFKEKVRSLFGENIFDETIERFMILVAFFTYYNKEVSLDLAYSFLGVNSELIQKVLRAPIFSIQEYSDSITYKMRTRFEADLLLQSFYIFVKTDYKWIAHYLCELLYLIENDDFNSIAKNEIIEKITKIISGIGPNSNDLSDIKWPIREFVRYAPCIITSLYYAAEAVHDPRLIIQELSYSREYCNSIYRDASIREQQMTFDDFKSFFHDIFSPDEIDGLSPEDLEIELTDVIKDGNYFLNECDIIDFELRAYYDQIRIEVANSRISMGDESNLTEAIRICEGVLNDNTSAYAITAWLKAFNALLDQSSESNYEIIEKRMAFSEHAVQKNPDLLDDIYFVKEYLKAVKDNTQRINNEKLNIYHISSCQVVTSALLYCWIYAELHNKGIITTDDKAIRWNDAPKNSCISNAIYELMKTMEQYNDLVQSNSNCAFLYLQLYWLFYNEEPLSFKLEKQHTRFSLDNWKRIEEVAQIIINCTLNENVPFLHQSKYVLALSLIHQGNCHGAKHLFKEIKKKLDYGRYYVKHLICDESGIPFTYSGRNIRFNQDGRNEARMDVYQGNKLIASSAYFNRYNIVANSATVVDEFTRFDNNLMLGVGFMGISALKWDKGE